MAAAGIGTGTTVLFEAVSLGNLISVSHSGCTRPAVSTAHMGSGNVHTYAAGDLVDYGEITVEVQLDTAATNTFDFANIIASLVIDVAAAGETATVDCFCSGHGFEVPNEEQCTATYTFKCCGAITYV